MANIQFQSDRTKNKGSEQRATGVRVFAYVLDRKSVSFRILNVFVLIAVHCKSVRTRHVGALSCLSNNRSKWRLAFFLEIAHLIITCKNFPYVYFDNRLELL